MTASANVVLAKVRAMYGRRLRADDYAALLNAHSVSELAGYLKNHTVYGAAMAGVNETAIHRGHLESLLRRSRFEQLAKLARYEDMVHMPLSDVLIRRDEIRQLLLFLRLLGAGRPEKYFFDLPYYFNQHSQLDLIGLANVRSFDELLPLLADTVYARPLRLFPPDEQGRLRIPEIETALYSDWYDEIFACVARHTHGEERQQLEELLSKELDTRNVLRIYRLKTYFHMTPFDIRLHLLAPHRGMSEKTLGRLLDAPADQVLTLFRQMPQGRGIGPEHLDNPSQLKQHVTALLGRHYTHYSTHPSVAALSYMFTSDTEVDDIVNIIEGIRYGLPPERIRRLLTVTE